MKGESGNSKASKIQHAQEELARSLSQSHANPLDSIPRSRIISSIIGCNVEQLRVQQRISKSRFALMVDIGRPFLDKIESGKADVRISTLVKLAEALDVDPYDLLAPHEQRVKSKYYDNSHYQNYKPRPKASAEQQANKSQNPATFHADPLYGKKKS